MADIALATPPSEQHKEHYLEELAQLAIEKQPDWLQHLHAASAARFRHLPFPNTRMEEWRQTNINTIVNTPWKSLVRPNTQRIDDDLITAFFYGANAWTELVFVDGFLAKDLGTVTALPDGVEVSGLRAALKGPHAKVVQEHLDQYLQDRNAYTALNSAFIQDGAFVYLTNNAVLQQPIHLVFVTTQREPETVAHLRNLIVLGTNSQATIITSYVNLAQDTRYLNNVVEEVVLQPNAHLRSYKLVEEGVAGNHLATTEVRQDRDSTYYSMALSMTGKIIRNQLAVRFDGPGASCSLTGLYLNDHDRLIDNALEITHAVPNCTSRIAYKGILDGTSKAVFTGKVHVHPDAQKTDSNQLSNNLMLSDTATIDSKPQLEIYADDVKCTHGATIGSPPAPIIFYFRSRGIDEGTARAMLTYGFAEEIVSEIEVEPLRERLGRYVYEKYSP